MKVQAPHLEAARAALHKFLNTPVADITPGNDYTPGGRMTLAEATQIGAQANTALDLLNGRLTVDDVKITLSATPEPSEAKAK